MTAETLPGVLTFPQGPLLNKERKQVCLSATDGT